MLLLRVSRYCCREHDSSGNAYGTTLEHVLVVLPTIHEENIKSRGGDDVRAHI